MTVHGAKGLQAPIVILPDTRAARQDAAAGWTGTARPLVPEPRLRRAARRNARSRRPSSSASASTGASSMSP